MYIALDMGTSNTRLWLCNDNGIVADARSPIGAGITKAKGTVFLYEELKKLIETLLADNNAPADSISCILASGMAGSELGLCEVAHIPLPTSTYALADHLHAHSIPEITEIPFLFVPGLKKASLDTLEDIMRGEETESLGIWNGLSLEQNAVFVLPGTHNKVIKILSDGTITDFYTTFSGELLNSIITHTILSGQTAHDFDLSEAWLLRGAAYARDNGLNAALFHIRVMEKNGMGRDVLSSFLYGCVLGQDADSILKFAAGDPIYIGGRKQLKHAYCALLGEKALALDETVTTNAVITGLSTIYRLRQARLLREDILKSIAEEKLIAIVRHPEEETFLTAMEALYRGGVRLAEITFDRSGKIPKTQTAHLIKLLKAHLPIHVGAGTVTSKEELLLAREAGASFIISPNCDPEIISMTRKLGLVSIPAAFTPTEIADAMKAGADYVKLFPADALPAGYCKAVTAPLSDAKLLAVGGVTKDNAGAFIANGFCGVGVGSGLYNKKLIADGDWAALENLAKAYADALK